jgi:ubiquinol-cytochrome c reductase iron-sulfur subunit
MINTNLPQRPRRDMLSFATRSVLAIGAGLVAWPLIAQFAPSADIEEPLEFDFAALSPGKELRFKANGNVFALRHRHPQEVALSKATSIDALLDRSARNENLELEALAKDENRSFGSQNQFTLMETSCPHLGVATIPNEGEFAIIVDNAKLGGRFCPVCASHFDTAGRFRKGVAGRNLRIPQFKLVGTHKLQVATGKFRLS